MKEWNTPKNILLIFFLVIFHFYTPPPSPANVRKALLFSCEYCELFKNTYFKEYLRTASVLFLERKCTKQVKMDETPQQVFSVEYYENLKKGFFYRTPPVAVVDKLMFGISNLEIRGI